MHDAQQLGAWGVGLKCLLVAKKIEKHWEPAVYHV